MEESKQHVWEKRESQFLELELRVFNKDLELIFDMI